MPTQPSHPYLLLEPGLNHVLPVTDALAQLGLLDELLGRRDVHFLGDSRLQPLWAAPTPARSLPLTYHVLAHQLLITQVCRHGVCFWKKSS